MYVKIRRIDNNKETTVTISKTDTISTLKQVINKKWNLGRSLFQLLYKGKILDDGNSIIDYNIQLNDVIQFMEKLPMTSSNIKSPTCQRTSMETKSASINKNNTELVNVECKYYRINDKIDLQDDMNGAWYEYIVQLIKANPNDIKLNGEVDASDIKYFCVSEFEPEQAQLCVDSKRIRPRSKYTYGISELSIDQTVFVNYNIDDPTKRGLWFDLTISKITTKGDIAVIGTLHLGEHKISLNNCKIIFIKDIMRIEKPLLIKDRVDTGSNIPMRKSQYFCEHCLDNKRRKCKECGCSKCGGKNEPSKIVICDQCSLGFHIFCLDPPLESTGSEDEDWYCPDCKTDVNEIVKPGDKWKEKKNLKSKQNEENVNGKKKRDWGKGMACVGRTKVCTIVPSEHFGPVPGIDVGTCWRYRFQVAEVGIHRPHVAGIHGRDQHGAYSIALSGGYEDDVDNGKEFLYTGSGGRNLSGNKRKAAQSFDQTLTKTNKALALNCNVEFNDKDGAEATDWKGGKPVRVVRSFKLKKHSKFAPNLGFRYDGTYKVVKYYPVRGKSGFIVWRYLLRRDDPTPAPWEKRGQEFEVIYPEGYHEANQGDQEMPSSHEAQSSGSEKNKPKMVGKRKFSKDKLKNDTTPKNKKSKVKFTLTKNVQKLIKNDPINDKLWRECKRVLNEGKQEFLKKVQEVFLCICCQEVVYKPVTTECKHNVCKM